MCNISHEVGAAGIGDGAELLPIGRPWIGSIASDDDPGTRSQRLVHDAIIVQLAVAIYAVRHHAVAAARDIEFAAMRQVPALEEVHTHQGVASLHEGIVDGEIGRCAGKGLNVDIDVASSHPLVCKAGGTAPLGQRLDKMHVIGALVEAAVGIAAIIGQLVAQIEHKVLIITRHAQRWIALSVDVVEHAAQSLAHRRWRNALRGDEDNSARLPLLLQGDDMMQIRVNVGQFCTKADFTVIQHCKLLYNDVDVC